MKEKWSPKFNNCKNCLTRRFSHKAMGYCSRCYPLIRRLAEIESWNLEKPQTLKSYPKDFIFRNLDTFEKRKKVSLRQYKERLASIKNNEENLNKPIIIGIELEDKIRHIADLVGVHGDKLFFGSANLFDHNFNKRQKKMLYELLNRITENVRWEGVNFY